jgi:Flp pilus assembly protein TadG
MSFYAWKPRQAKYPASHRASLAGQGLVEFALVLPLLLLILIGVLDLGRLSFAAMTVTNAAREGARYGATNPTATSAIVARAQNEAYGSIISPSQLIVSTPTFPEGCALGKPIQVTVTYNFQLITAYVFGGGTIPLRASAQFPVFGTCP